MNACGHLKRYGVRRKKDEVTDVEVRGDGVVSASGKLWDLRAGEAKKGWERSFYASGDGRACAYGEDGALAVVRPDGSRVPLAFPEPPSALRSGGVFWVGDFIVARDQHAKPWIVMNAKTGAVVGRLTAQRKDAAIGYCPSVFDPHDGATLLFCDREGVQRVRASDANLEDVLKAPEGIRLVACAVTSNGDFVLLERSTKADAAFDTSHDAVVVRDPSGREKARLTAGRPPFQVNRLGEGILVTDAAGFAILDDDLRELTRVPFVDDDTFARTIPLPSGREWIAIGGFSQWDHYGEVALGPTSSGAAPAKTKSAQAKTPAAKKPTAKKQARGR